MSMDIDFSESGDDESGTFDNELGEMLDIVGRKCSICFTSDSDTDLGPCGDQFCFECIEK